MFVPLNLNLDNEIKFKLVETDPIF